MNRKVLGFESLEVWQLFLVHNKFVYTSIKAGPMIDWDLIRQLRRAMVSVGLNIAEGYARDHLKEKIQFFNIAKSSVNEVMACLLIIQSLECENKTYAEINLLIENLNVLHAKSGKFKKYFESKSLK